MLYTQLQEINMYTDFYKDENGTEYQVKYNGKSNLGRCYSIYVFKNGAYVYEGDFHTEYKRTSRVIQEFYGLGKKQKKFEVAKDYTDTSFFENMFEYSVGEDSFRALNQGSRIYHVYKKDGDSYVMSAYVQVPAPYVPSAISIHHEYQKIENY